MRELVVRAPPKLPAAVDDTRRVVVVPVVVRVVPVDAEREPPKLPLRPVVAEPKARPPNVPVEYAVVRPLLAPRGPL